VPENGYVLNHGILICYHEATPLRKR